jgi:putative transposase
VHRDHVEKAIAFIRSQKGFKIQPRRWVVERTFAWISKQRRLSKDYEYLPEVSEAYLYAAMAVINVRKIAQTNIKIRF